MKRLAALGLTLGLFVTPGPVPVAGLSETGTIDHFYRDFGELLRQHVVGARVDYATLAGNRNKLDAIVETFGQVTELEFERWSREQQIAYLINAYNAFTLQAIIDHYPIDGGWFSFVRWAPRNSIKQINGVWTKRRWSTAGAEITLDELEHETLRARYAEPRIHFAINCAAVSCPPLRQEPYVAERLDRQLIVAARDFLASPDGLQVEGNTILASRVFDWFGDDFIEEYSHLVDGPGSDRDRAVLGIVAKYGPVEASEVAQSGNARLRFLSYDWGLNDLENR